MRLLLLLFIIVPVTEMWLLIEVGSVIGAFFTITLVLLTAMIGVALLRREGLSTLTRGNQKMERGELPAQEMLEGIILAVCGALLLTPGFVTDAVGFLGLIPLSRKMFVQWLLRKGVFQSVSFGEHHFRSGMADQDQHIIEGEYWQNDQKDK